MKIRITIFLTINLILSSCTTGYINHLKGSKEILITGFPKTVECKPDTFIIIPGIDELIVTDTFLIGCNHRGIDGFFKVYNLNNLEYLGSLIRNGKGPNEFLTLDYHKQYTNDSAGCHMWLSDWGMINKNYLVNITKSLKNPNNLFVDTSIVLPHKYMGDYFFIEDSLLTCIPYGRKRKTNLKYIEYNFKSDSVEFSKDIYTDEFSNKEDNINYIYKLMVTPNQALDRFVAINSRLNKIHFFSRKFENISTLNIFNTISEDELKNKKNKEWIRYYYDVCATNKYVFALYVNKKHEYLFNEDDYNGSEIHVFNWEGNPIASIKVPQNIWQLRTNIDGEYLYGLKHYNEKIFRYNLKNVIYK